MVGGFLECGWNGWDRDQGRVGVKWYWVGGGKRLMGGQVDGRGVMDVLV